MSDYRLSRLFDKFDSAVNMSDFSVEELTDMLRSQEGDGHTANGHKADEFKQKYFEYYDDVKDSTLPRQDW